MSKTELIGSDNRYVVIRGWFGMGQWKGWEVWTFSFKVSKSWVCNVQCDCSQWYTIYLVVAKRTNIANPHHKGKKQFYKFVWWQIIVRLKVVIISQCLQVLNHYDVHLKLT